MPGSTGNITLDVILVSAAVVAALLVLGRAVWAVIKGFAKMVRFSDDVRQELKPNSGSSLRDAVDRIEAEQTKAAELAIAQTQLMATQGQRLEDLTKRFNDHIAEGE